MQTNIHFISYLAQFFLEWEMFQTEVVEEIKTQFLCSIKFFPRNSCRLWDNMKTWRMRIAFWLTKVTNIHSEFVILIAFPLQQWLQERALFLRYTYEVC